jgi:hypothetical protein
MTMNRRRLFALAGGASAAATLPAIAAPMVEMHAADVTPVPFTVERYVSDFGTLTLVPNRYVPVPERIEWTPLGEPVIWSWRNG